jgi:4'-phosphopantetheinyl transferase
LKARPGPGSRTSALELRPGEVQLWKVRVPRDARAVGDALERLAPGERAWARRLRVADARARFVVARAALRALLGAYLGRPPRRIEIDPGPDGKPALRARAGAVPLHFSVSHSGSLALLAFSSDGPVGVDVEWERELPNALPLAERFFSPRERRAVQAARSAERSRVFLSVWTAKEAVLKARGDGLAGLDQVELTRPGAGSGEPQTAIEEGGGRWMVQSLAPARGHVGALATRPPARSLWIRSWRAAGRAEGPP